MRCEKLGMLAVGATVLFLAVLVAGYVWEGATGNVSAHLIISFGLSSVVLCLLIVLNVFLYFGSGRRSIYLALTISIAIAFAVSPLCAKWRVHTLRRKFLNVELPVYGSIVSQICQPGAAHTGEFRPLTGIGRLNVSSRIRNDGSLTIFFFDTADWIHGGYMYYAGDQLILRKDNSGEYFSQKQAGRAFYV